MMILIKKVVHKPIKVGITILISKTIAEEEIQACTREANKDINNIIIANIQISQAIINQTLLTASLHMLIMQEVEALVYNNNRKQLRKEFNQEVVYK